MTRSLSALPAILLLFLLYSCQQEISAPQAEPALFTLRAPGGGCLTDTAIGTYRAGGLLSASTHYIQAQVQVQRAGAWSFHTDTQNGFSFAGSGTFTTTGLQTVRLAGAGTPLQAGPSTFRLLQDSTLCPVVVTVQAALPGGGPTSGACGAQVSGSYKKDSALGASHQVTMSHTYGTTGTFTASTDTVNGYSFRTTATVVAAGPASLVLAGSGTPLAAGTDSFTVRFGDGSSCGFRVAVTAGAPGSTLTDTSYMPLAVGNWWSYTHPDDPAQVNPVDSLTVRLSGTLLRGGQNVTGTQTYFFGMRTTPLLTTSAPLSTWVDDSLLYRKDAAGNVFQNVDLAKLVGNWVYYDFNPGRGELPIFKPGVATGGQWYSDVFNAVDHGSGQPRKVRVHYTMVNASQSAQMNWNSFTGVAYVTYEIETSDDNGTTWNGTQTPLQRYFKRGIGIVAEGFFTQYMPIRYWHMQ